MTPEEKRIRALRAAEVLEAAAWAFDELVQQAQRRWLMAATPAAREDCHANALAALALKGRLMAIVNEQQAEEVIHERREQRNG